MLIITVFVFTLGYSLSMFNRNESNIVANIKVNDLLFNITTNGGTNDDRVLHLQANKIESFSIIITNLNKINTKYELIYNVCIDLNCTSLLNSLPDGVKVEFMKENSNELSGLINNNGETKKINLLTTNNLDNDIYIKLNLNAGYEWNELELANQIRDYSKIMDIIAYVDGVEVNNYPDTCNYTVDTKAYINNKEIILNDLKVECDRSTKLWKTSYTGFADKIEIKFNHVQGTILVYYVTNLFETNASDNGLIKDTTAENNIRYNGANPKNYIEFGNKNELWRIIGIFNVFNNETNQEEKMIKIIRNESLGEYAWDVTDEDSSTDTRTNDWNKADLMLELNNDYLDISKTSGITQWYYNYPRETADYDYSNNIKSNYQYMISDVKWNLGGYKTSSKVGAKEMYDYERGALTYEQNPISWNGKIGLMYPSDYAFSSAKSSCWSDLYSGNCNVSNWLYIGKYQRTITQCTEYPGTYFVNSGVGVNLVVSSSSTIRPTLYLKSDVVITGGTGTESDPYIIE